MTSTEQVLLRANDGSALMTLSRLHAQVPAPVLDAARCELADYVHTSSDGLSQQWGYFPDLGPDPGGYPCTVALARELAEQAGHPWLRLAFIRLALGTPKSDFGGTHIDVHAGVAHEWPQEVPTDWHVLRVLINIGDTPRRLEYCPLTADLLGARYGMKISRQRYQVLELPVGAPQAFVDIPPIQDEVPWCLRFVSSLVPHAGRTDDRGHFLASFGGYFPPGLLATICR